MNTKTQDHVGPPVPSKASKKLTPWFPASVKPAREGVYETDCGFQHWNGAYWGFFCSTKRNAAHFAAYRSVSDHPKWRGLAKKPARSA